LISEGTAKSSEGTELVDGVVGLLSVELESGEVGVIEKYQVEFQVIN